MFDYDENLVSHKFKYEYRYSTAGNYIHVMRDDKKGIDIMVGPETARFVELLVSQANKYYNTLPVED